MNQSNNPGLEKLRYPIGKFTCPDNITPDHLVKWIDVLERLPDNIQNLVSGLTDQQLDTPYREGGWTIRQVVHHLSDSHHNSYIRFKWALTEDRPVIKFYYEKLWADLDDARTGPIQMSLDHLRAVHVKLVYLLKSLTDDQLNRTFIHPEHSEETSLKENIGKYAWHSRHHLQHIKNLINRKGWI